MCESARGHFVKQQDSVVMVVRGHQQACRLHRPPLLTHTVNNDGIPLSCTLWVGDIATNVAKVT